LSIGKEKEKRVERTGEEKKKRLKRNERTERMKEKVKGEPPELEP
jgi:hypothetical protein